MTKRRLLIWIPVAAIFLNGLIYLIVVNLRTPPKTPTGATAKLPTGTAPPGGSQEQQGRKAEGDNSPEKIAADDEHAKEEKAMARRSAGLAALDAGDYAKALIDFTEARALIGDKANVGELLRVTEDLRSHPRPAPSARPPAPPAPSRAVSRSPARSYGGRRVALREEPAAEVPAAPAPPPPSGLVIVTTTPRGLLVQVDDTAVDLTPMRTRVKPGSHRIALLDGDRKVYETTIDVKEGGTTTLLKDLPMPLEGVSEAPRTSPTPAPAPVAPVVKEEPPRQVAAAAAPGPSSPPPPPVEPAAPAGETSGETGALQITSPGLYGIVWVNGRPRGYPPLEVRELASGPVKVEVRVNGIEKRGSTVVVAPGRTTIVTLR